MSLVAQITGASPQARIASAAPLARLSIANAAANLTPILPNSLLGRPSAATSLEAQAALVPAAPVVDGLGTYRAAIALSALRAVWMTADGLCYASTADADSCDAVLGLTTHATPAQGSVIVRTDGEVEDSSWSWIASEPIYLGSDGYLTQTSNDDLPIVELGIALTPTRLRVRIQQALYPA